MDEAVEKTKEDVVEEMVEPSTWYLGTPKARLLYNLPARNDSKGAMRLLVGAAGPYSPRNRITPAEKASPTSSRSSARQRKLPLPSLC